MGLKIGGLPGLSGIRVYPSFIPPHFSATLWRMVVVFIDPDFIGFYRGFIVILTSVSGFYRAMH